ncbi:MAG: stalk domain-containing protein [Bacillota bacterium]|jgi:hypothetical protein
MKKLVFVLVLVCVLTVFASPAMAADIKIIINDKHIVSDVSPMVEGGRTMVPLRIISENLGALVEYHNQQIDVKSPYLYGSFTLKLHSPLVYSYKAPDYINQSKYMDITPFYMKGRVFVPLRFIAEELRCRVDYSRGAVNIASPEKGIVSLEEALRLTKNQCSKDYPGMNEGAAYLLDENDEAYLIDIFAGVNEVAYRVDKDTGAVKKVGLIAQEYWRGMFEF